MISESVANEGEKKSRLNPLWLVLAAVTIAGKWGEAFGVLNVLAEIARRWLDFWREAWRLLFAAIEPYAQRTFPTETHDMLTLIGTLLATVGVGQWLLQRGKHEPVTTRSEVQRFVKGPPILVGIATASIILLALALIVMPFFEAIRATVAENVLGSERAAAAEQISDNLNDWFSLVAIVCGVLILLIVHGRGGAALELVFLVVFAAALIASFATTYFAFDFVRGLDAAIPQVPVRANELAVYLLVALIPLMQKAAEELSDERSSKWRAVIISIPILILFLGPAIYLFTPPAFYWLTPHSALWYSFCAVLAFIAARSALPLVQLAGLVVVILAADFVCDLALTIWSTINAPAA